MDVFVSSLSRLGLGPWDLAPLAAWAALAAATAALGLEKAYKALFGLALGCVMYVAADWFTGSLSSMPLSPETRGFLAANQAVLLHAAWAGIWVAPLLAAFSPSLAVTPHVRGPVGLVLRVVLVPAIMVAAFASVFVLSAERAFPFGFDNLLAKFPAVAHALGGGSSAYGVFREYGVLAVAAAIVAGTYAILLSPWIGRFTEKLDAARLPSFFRDARPAAPAPQFDPAADSAHDPHAEQRGHGAH